MHTYAIMFMVALYSFMIIGTIIGVIIGMRMVSPHVHTLITERMYRERDMHTTMYKHMHINNKEGK